MSVEIKWINDNRYTVNGKVVYKNIDGNWVHPHDELTPSESRAFREYLCALEMDLDRRKN